MTNIRDGAGTKLLTKTQEKQIVAHQNLQAHGNATNQHLRDNHTNMATVVKQKPQKSNDSKLPIGDRRIKLKQSSIPNRWFRKAMDRMSNNTSLLKTRNSLSDLPKQSNTN